MIVPVAVCACGFALGVVGFVFSLRGADHAPLLETTQTSSPTSMPNGARGRNDARGIQREAGSSRALHDLSLRISLSIASALLVVIVTRWPVAGLLAAAAAFILPSVLKATSRNSTRLTEAVAVWTELLRDTLTASAGLAQAIVATAGLAPVEIRVAVTHLGDRIVSGVPVDDALQMFAVEVDEPCAEQVVSALRLAETSRAQRLVDLLSALADSTREEVAMRLRVEASRASARSGVRTTIWFSVGFVLLLSVFAHSYLAPFGTTKGQLVLAFVGACYATGLFLMVRLVRPVPSVQFPRRAALP